jgi:hypothetical protein
LATSGVTAAGDVSGQLPGGGVSAGAAGAVASVGLVCGCVGSSRWRGCDTPELGFERVWAL